MRPANDNTARRDRPTLDSVLAAMAWRTEPADLRALRAWISAAIQEGRLFDAIRLLRRASGMTLYACKEHCLAWKGD